MWVDFLLCIAVFIAWIVFEGKLKRFDKYLWSPFVVSFSVICLGWIMFQYSGKGFLPYIAGSIACIILRYLKKKGWLKRFDKYLWSPFVVSFSVVCLSLILIKYGNKDVLFSVNGLLSFVLTFLMFSQFLWFSLIFQVLAIKYNKEYFLTIARIVVWIAIITALLLIYGFSQS